jgi:hypothetical protein
VPFTWRCEADGVAVESTEQCRQHEVEAHGGVVQAWSMTFTPRVAGGKGRTWSCARCTRQVARDDDGSMLCDVCKGSEPALTCAGTGRHWGAHLECPVCLRTYRQLVGRRAKPTADGRAVRGVGRLVPEHKP